MQRRLTISVLLCSASALAQTANSEPVAVLELGGAPAWNLKDSGSNLAPTAAVEFTLIEDWLEIETGVTPIFSHSSTEWDTDLLFKKPWTLSRKVEFMFGAGPEWIHTRQRGVTTNAPAAEVALDFMFWPAAKHRFGWYLEPAYEYSFGPGHERSVGVSIGLLIGVNRPRR